MYNCTEPLLKARKFMAVSMTSRDNKKKKLLKTIKQQA